MHTSRLARRSVTTLYRHMGSVWANHQVGTFGACAEESLGHHWITYLQKMRMPIPHTGNMHQEMGARARSQRPKARYTAIMPLA
jgi:hypothetical protein